MSANNKELKTAIIWGAAIFAAYKFVLEPVLEGLNLKDTKEEEQANKTTQEYGGASGKTVDKNPWNPNFYRLMKNELKQGQSIQLLTVSQMNSMALTIWDAKGSLFSSLPFWDDNEAAVYGVMRKITSQTQLSQFAERFQLNYDRDLYEYLSSFLNAAELGTVNTIVKGYKKGIIINNKLT